MYNEVFYVCKYIKEYDTSTQACEDSNVITIFQRCQGNNYDHSTKYCYDGTVKNKEIFTDERDGKTYKYVIIGDQVWMAENLKYEAPNTRCYGDDQNNCEIFGKMYDWETAIIVCPSGWRLPNDNDFSVLKNFVEAASKCRNCAGIVLKANSALWNSNKGADEFGFTALPGGYYRENHPGDDNNGFNQKNMTAGFWSTTEGYIKGSAHFRYFTSYFTGYNSSLNNMLNIEGFYINESFANVRCIKD